MTQPSDMPLGIDRQKLEKLAEVAIKVRIS
jgi:hypothetical protein